jgi:enterochelin esterase-like enzyme
LPQPQSTVFFLLLMVIFAGLVCWLVLTRHLVLRVLAACLAFIPAVIFGVAAVNKYYDYYQSWSAAISDVTSQGVPGTPVAATPASLTGNGVASLLGNGVDTRLAQVNGYTLRLTVRGKLSHLTRTVYVYLPPQYFQPRYRHYRFPTIELVHGYPGAPQDWITVLDITSTLAGLINRGEAKPAVLVMPDANGSRGISLQCLNAVNGPQDATFMAEDVPDYISHVLRVWPPGRTWAIAGYSEGGFCAANLGLQYGNNFDLAGVLSGYFSPSDDRVGNPTRSVNPFGSSKLLRKENTPTWELLHLPAGAKIPGFWIGSGTDQADARPALIFKQLLQLRQPTVQFKLVPGVHSMFTWRALVPQMLEWMTPKLTVNVKLVGERDKRLAREKARASASPGPGRPAGQPARHHGRQHASQHARKHLGA